MNGGALTYRRDSASNAKYRLLFIGQPADFEEFEPKTVDADHDA